MFVPSSSSGAAVTITRVTMQPGATTHIDTTTPAGRMMMQMVGSFAEFERAMIRERTSAGIAAARAEGRVGGRRKKLDATRRRDADFVAPLARLAERLAEVARSKEAVRSLDVDGSANDLRRIVAFLRARTGHDFSSYKRATVMRHVVRRMQVCRTNTLEAYADYLLTMPEETKELFSDLLISVTMFFRDPGAFAALERLVVGPLFNEMDPEAETGLRAWVVGCATGEEAYSLAILLHEEAARRKLHPRSRSSPPTSTTAPSPPRARAATRAQSRSTSRRIGWRASSSTRARITGSARSCATPCCSPSTARSRNRPSCGWTWSPAATC